MDKLDTKNFIRLSKYVSLFSFLYYFPLIFKDYLYFDDFERSVIGVLNTGVNGRPIGSWLLALFQFNLTELDTKVSLIHSGPYFSLIALVIFIIAISLFVEKIATNKSLFFKVVFALSLMFSPNFLQNFSFNFDGLYSIVAVFFSFIAIINFNQSNLRNILIGSLVFALALGSYQASFNLFFGLIALSSFINIIEEKNTAFKELLINSSKLIFGFLIYRFVIFNNIKEFDSYYYAYSKLIKFDDNFIPYVLNNIFRVTEILLKAFSNSYFLFIFLIISFIFFVIKVLRESKKSYLKLFAFLLSLIAIVASLYGFLVIQNYLYTEPRIFFSLSILYGITIYSFLFSIEYLKNISFKVFAVLPIIYCLFICYSYSTVLKEQIAFGNTVISSMKDSLKTYGFTSSSTLLFDGIFYDGSTGLNSPVVTNSVKHNSLLNFLFRNYLGEKWYTSAVLRYQGSKIHIEDLNIKENKQHSQICDSMPIFLNEYFKLHKLDNLYLISIKKGHCSRKRHYQIINH
jgi:hypothetical protein